MLLQDHRPVLRLPLVADTRLTFRRLRSPTPLPTMPSAPLMARCLRGLARMFGKPDR